MSTTTTTTPQWLVPLSETTLGEEEALVAADVVRSGWLTQGARVLAFEQAFAKFIGVPHAVAVANCTVGLEIAFDAVGVKPGDEVIVPSITFVATANAARRLGATPVFADVLGPDDLTLDPADVARRVTPRTRAIAPVHYAGWPADMGALRAIASEHGIALVEDCAHAPGARSPEGPCGTLGDIGAFSFFSNKNMATGEGGMLTTSRDDIAARARLLRSHGMTSTTWDRHRGHAYTYDVAAVGTNARLDEIRAAIGIIQLARLPGGNAVRAKCVERYRERLRDVPRLHIPFAGRDLADGAHHLFVVLLPPGTDRVAVMTSLREARVQTSIHYPPTHRFTAYAGLSHPLPVTDAIADRILTLPLYSTMTLSQVDLVSDALRTALG
ncbi:MAG: DegT/DnrJ/EryC1/StrS family aminotransferase [Deltaproteobacteria bacterium]